MICALCQQKPAKVHVTDIVCGEGKEETHQIDLCMDCARAKGVDNPNSFALADLLLEFAEKRIGGESRGELTD